MAAFVVYYRARQFDVSIYRTGVQYDRVRFCVAEHSLVYAVVRRVFAKRREIARLLTFKLDTPIRRSRILMGERPWTTRGTINGTYRARTYDPLLVRQMLSQLS